MSSAGRVAGAPSYDRDSIGFRLASPVPEPATQGMASGEVLVAGGSWVLRRRDLKRWVIEVFLEVSYSTKKEPAMTHQDVGPAIDDIFKAIS